MDERLQYLSNINNSAADMQPFLCPTCTQKVKSFHARTQILPLSHHCPLLLPLQPTGAKEKKVALLYLLILFFFKRGNIEKFMTRGGGRFWDDQQRSLKDLRWQMCVKAKCKCVLWVLAWDGVPQGGLLSVLPLRDYTAHPSTLGAISHRLLLPLPSFPACQANRFSRALISGSAFAFFCALRHPLISLIPIWHQIIDTAGLLANSGVLRSTLDLCGCVSLALPPSPLRLFSSELSACRAAISRGLHHGTLHLSHMHPHTV